MKHEWYWDEAGECTQCKNCGYVRAEEYYRKCGEPIEKGKRRGKK